MSKDIEKDVGEKIKEKVLNDIADNNYVAIGLFWAISFFLGVFATLIMIFNFGITIWLAISYGGLSFLILGLLIRLCNDPNWVVTTVSEKYYTSSSPGATQPIVGVYFTALYQALASLCTRLLDHTQRRATVGRTPLNE